MDLPPRLMLSESNTWMSWFLYTSKQYLDVKVQFYDLGRVGVLLAGGGAMIISQSAEYALRAVVWLAQEPERSLGTGQIARAARVPPGYLAKVLQSLSRAGLVSSSPGRRGGFRLLKSPDSISVLEVIDAVDPIRRITTCPLGLPGHGEDLCPLHRRLDDAAQQMQAAFAGATIADLLSETTTSPPLREL